MRPDAPSELAEIDIASLLDGLPQPAVVIAKDHRILASNAAYRQKYNHGGVVRGRRCFEVSHDYSMPCNEVGENCPIDACGRTGEPTTTIHIHHTHDGKELEEVTTYSLAGGNCFLEVIRKLEFASARSSATQLVGRSRPFQRMLELVRRVAPRDTTVLLLGESGTGKDLAARAVHSASQRADHKFVPVDCSGLPEALFESELFGHEKGSFTGATSRKLGLVEAARGGTLFLDELGDIPLAFQVKLLRLVETGLYRRVGSSELREADFRLVCATHRNLKEMVADGTFRRDLYYRISAFPIELPPLRGRLDDLPLLARSIGKRLQCEGLVNISSETLEVLARYHFPGNVRELFNILERACLLSDQGIIRPEHLPAEVLEATGARARQAAAERELVPLVEAEHRYLRWASATFRGSKRELAKSLGVSERTLYRKLREAEIG